MGNTKIKTILESAWSTEFEHQVWSLWQEMQGAMGRSEARPQKPWHTLKWRSTQTKRQNSTLNGKATGRYQCPACLPQSSGTPKMRRRQRGLACTHTRASP